MSEMLSLERANEIVSAMVRHHTAVMIEDTPPDVPTWLKEVPLAEMVAAQTIVKDDDKRRDDGRCSVICDDRLVAAYYTFLHYQPSRTPSGSFEPIVYTKSRALVCCDSTAFKEDDQ